jgi:hypothetical protein
MTWPVLSEADRLSSSRINAADQNHEYGNNNKPENATLYENHQLTSKLNR